MTLNVMNMYLENENSPHNIEELEDDEEGVEDVVGREHVNVLFSRVESGVENARGKQDTSRDDIIENIIIAALLPCEDPGDSEASKDDLRQLLFLHIFD